MGNIVSILAVVLLSVGTFVSPPQVPTSSGSVSKFSPIDAQTVALARNQLNLISNSYLSSDRLAKLGDDYYFQARIYDGSKVLFSGYCQITDGVIQYCQEGDSKYKYICWADKYNARNILISKNRDLFDVASQVKCNFSPLSLLI